MSSLPRDFEVFTCWEDSDYEYGLVAPHDANPEDVAREFLSSVGCENDLWDRLDEEQRADLLGRISHSTMYSVVASDVEEFGFEEGGWHADASGKKSCSAWFIEGLWYFVDFVAPPEDD